MILRMHTCAVWLKETGVGRFPDPSCYEFPSIVTNRRIWNEAATPPEQAWRQLEAWAASPCNHPIGETDSFIEILGGPVQRPHVRDPIVHDARVDAICLAHGAEALLTRDRDFALFPELTTRRPFRHH